MEFWYPGSWLGAEEFIPYSPAGGFKPETVLTDPNSLFARRLTKNDVASVVIASAIKKEEQILISTKVWSSSTVQDLGTVTLAIQPTESNEQLMRRAVDSVSRKLDDKWKQSNLRDSASQLRSIDIVFQLQSVNDFVAIQKNLDTIPQIRGRSLIALHRRAAQIQLEYGSDLAQLKFALSQRGFTFVTNDEVPILRLSTSKSAGADSPLNPAP